MPFLINQLQTSLTLAAITAGSLADHKQQLAKAIDANGASFSTNLSSERSAILRNSIPGTLRVLLGALIVTPSSSPCQGSYEGASDSSPWHALPSPKGDWGLIRRQVSIGMGPPGSNAAPCLPHGTVLIMLILLILWIVLP
jgi:hypothetical protein